MAAARPAIAAVPERRAARPRVLLAATAVVVVLLALPPAFLLIEAYGAGVSTVWHLIFRELTATLLRNSIELGAVVTPLSAVIGTAAAFFVERTELRGRAVWTTLLIMPLAIPDFVVAFGWSSLTNWIEGFRGAVVVMTLALYPLVYLPVAASLRNSDPGQEEVARSLGVGRLATFRRITLGQARGAILGGCLLVVLVLLAEFGAFEIIGFRTFSTEIYIEFNVSFDVPAAAALSLALVALCVLLLLGETFLHGRGRVARAGPLTQRFGRPHRLGAWSVAVIAGLAALVALSVGVPLYAALHWTFGRGGAVVDWSTLVNAFWHTMLYSAPAALLATAMAVPVALLVVRYPGRGNRILERSTYLVLAMPSMIAFSLSYFTGRYVNGFAYQSAPLLMLAYAVLFFPFALVAVRASAARVPAALEEVGRSLGRPRWVVLTRITLPLLAPGLAAAFCLVFLSSVIELTTTLILIPTGSQTLSTEFWSFQQNLAYSQAAPYALAMIVVAAIPAFILGRFFSRTAVSV
ncbi:MAG TPA: iron ABC transporter permease [Gaiellaceae bacterium]|nr:iron ABC transporter permease [Gaiellaceae bacterium]